MELYLCHNTWKERQLNPYVSSCPDGSHAVTHSLTHDHYASDASGLDRAWEKVLLLWREDFDVF